LSAFWVTAAVEDQAVSVTVSVMNPEGPVVVMVSVVIDTRITVVGGAEAVTVTAEGIGYGSGPESVIVTNAGPELLVVFTVPPGKIGAASGFEGWGWDCRGFNKTPEVDEHDAPLGLAFWIGMCIGVMIKCGDPSISLVS
jgi:hypothetical protein